jgi:hypothetical protein
MSGGTPYHEIRWNVEKSVYCCKVCQHWVGNISDAAGERFLFSGRLEIVGGWVVLDLQSQLTYNGLRA